ncbi:MAG: TonB-dependent receptor [Acidobacteria bacterium]|nr:TonB-dependent receptor [Acidobacteriota bacterium]
MTRVWSFVVALLLAVGVTPALAQRTTGEISGKVVDESGGTLPGVTVTLRGEAMPNAQPVITSETGLYRFPVLPAGTYDVEFALEGFGTAKYEAIRVAVGQTIDVNVTMKVSSLNETLTVTGTAPVVNVTTSEVSTNYNREWVQSAPVRRFSYFDLINSAPGVSSTSNVGQSTSAQVLGNSTNENQYQIDGTDISSTPWPNTDAIEEVQVLSMGASAEYGNVQGAVFNIVTRQGTNVFHGDANTYFQSSALTGRNTTAAVDKGFPYNRDTYRDGTIQASGPFIPDKLWFFGSLQYQRDWDSQPGVDPKLPTKNDSRRMFYKFNYAINDKHRLMHGYHNDFYYIPDIATSFTAPTSVSISHGDNPTPNVVYTGVLSSKTFVEARYSGFFLHSSVNPLQDGVPSVMTRVEDQDTGLITGGITAWNENRSWKWGSAVKLSHVIDSFLGGSHDIKTGYQYGVTGSDNLNGPNDTLTTYSLTGRQTTGITQLPYHQGAEAIWNGLYVDDTYRLPRAVLNLGVRYDHSRATFPSFPFLNAQGLPTGQSSTANDDVYHWNTFSPRVGLNWQVTESGNTVVKAHYGRYYKALEPNEYRGAVPSISPAYSFTVDAAGNRTNVVQTSSNANLRIDPNFKSAYNDQFMLQLEQQLVRDLGLQLNYVHKTGEGYGAWQDIAGTYVQVPYVDNAGVDATGQTVMVWKLLSNPADRVFLMTNPDGMYMKYNGVTASLTKRMSKNWQAVYSIVLSKAEGRIGSSARATSTTTQSSQAGTFGRETAGPNDFVNTDGLLVGDRPVVSKLQLSYKLPYGILVATNLQYQSGRFYSRQVRVAGLGFPSAPTINMEANTGDRRVPPVKMIDFRAQKDIKLTASSNIGLFLDVLNLTNSDQNEGVASTLGTSASFGVPTRFVPPRRAMFGIKYRW